jgi:hypothetical protein
MPSTAAQVAKTSPIQNPNAYAVAPVSGSPSKMGATSSMKQQLGKKDLWVFMIIAIILLIVLYYISSNHCEVLENLKTCSWNNYYYFGAIVLAIGVLVLAYGCYMAFCVADNQSKTLIAISFGLISVLLIVAFTLFFRNGNFSGAFYTSLFILLVAVLCMYFCYRVKRAAGYTNIVFVIVAIILAWGMWDVTSNNCNREPHKKHSSHHHKH